MYYIHKHHVSQQYGGPEEGGWWYEHGTPVNGWRVQHSETSREAYDICRELNDLEMERRKKEEDYEYHSVLSDRSTFYAYSVSTSRTPVEYPATRPHYE